jgi:hypothetical protein
VVKTSLTYSLARKTQNWCAPDSGGKGSGIYSPRFV